jgi:hypothetical protein
MSFRLEGSVQTNVLQALGKLSMTWEKCVTGFGRNRISITGLDFLIESMAECECIYAESSLEQAL